MLSAEGISCASAWARAGSPRALTRRSGRESGTRGREGRGRCAGSPVSGRTACSSLGRKHHGVRVVDGAVGSPVAREQRDDAVGDLGLASLALLLGQAAQRTGDERFDVPGERGVRLGGIDGRGVDERGPARGRERRAQP